MKTRILIIDDEPRWVEFVRNVLDDFEVVVASDTDTVITQLEADQFALVIASSRRLEALEVIAERFPDKCVLVTTIQPTTQEALTAYRLGARRYFTKSFGSRDFCEQVKDFIPSFMSCA